jgi:hypothetical protein
MMACLQRLKPPSVGVRRLPGGKQVIGAELPALDMALRFKYRIHVKPQCRRFRRFSKPSDLNRVTPQAARPQPLSAYLHDHN